MITYYRQTSKITLTSDHAVMYFDTDSLKLDCIRTWEPWESYQANYNSLEELEEDVASNLNDKELGYELVEGTFEFYGQCEFCSKWLPIADLKTVVDHWPNGNPVSWKQCLPCEQGFDNE